MDKELVNLFSILILSKSNPKIVVGLTLGDLGSPNLTLETLVQATRPPKPKP